MQLDLDYFEKADAPSLAEFHDTYMEMYDQKSKWADLTDEEKLGFSVEIVDMVLSSDPRSPVKAAWWNVYAATQHIYPPIPQAQDKVIPTWNQVASPDYNPQDFE